MNTKINGILKLALAVILISVNFSISFIPASLIFATVLIFLARKDFVDDGSHSGYLMRAGYFTIIFASLIFIGSILSNILVRNINVEELIKIYDLYVENPDAFLDNLPNYFELLGRYLNSQYLTYICTFLGSIVGCIAIFFIGRYLYTSADNNYPTSVSIADKIGSLNKKALTTGLIGSAFNILTGVLIVLFFNSISFNDGGIVTSTVTIVTSIALILVALSFAALSILTLIFRIIMIVNIFKFRSTFINEKPNVVDNNEFEEPNSFDNESNDEE